MSNNKNKNSPASMGASASKPYVRDDSSTNATGQRVDSRNRFMVNVDKGSSSVDASYAEKVKSKSPQNQPGAKSQLATHSAGETADVHKPPLLAVTSEHKTGTMEGIVIPHDSLPCESVETLFGALEALQNALPSAKTEIPKLLNAIKENENLQEKVEKLERSIQVTNDAKDKDKNTYLAKYKELKSSEVIIQKKYNDSLKELAEANKTNKEFADEVKRLMAHEQSLRLENQHLRKELEDSRRSSEKSSQELSECKSRLSKLLSNKLTENNPQIADLSDTNRPTKLGEKHSELYDNQWTNAFEVLEETSNNEEKTIQDLLNLYLSVYTFCKEKARDQIDQLKQVAYMWGSEVDQKADSLELKTQVKEFRKYTAELSVKAIFQEYIQKHVAKDYLQIVTTHEISQYVEACLKVCWLMNAQDPPVVIAALPQADSKFNTELYKPYTQSGDNVQYLVWPALLLHDRGSTLVKGVAQAYKIGKTRQTTNRPTSESLQQEMVAQREQHTMKDERAGDIDPRQSVLDHSENKGFKPNTEEENRRVKTLNDKTDDNNTYNSTPCVSGHQEQNLNNTHNPNITRTYLDGVSGRQGQTMPYSQYPMNASSRQAEISCHQEENNTQYPMDTSTGEAGLSGHGGQNLIHTQFPINTSTGPAGISAHQGQPLHISQNKIAASVGQASMSGYQRQDRHNTINTNASGTWHVVGNSQQPYNWQYTDQANASSSRQSNIGHSPYDVPRSATYSTPIQSNVSTTHGMPDSTDSGQSSEIPTADEWETFKRVMHTEGQQKCILLMGIESYNRCEQYYIKNYT
ncbi:uncharacterized protein LOC127876537 [Dreissena polymorpha]|uniref:Mitochondria-eating protein n=1 Tax=Dreissena polymorpha TaxID=45954 RepID=A0A9D4QTD7_DREPO|nr:uncharacterized protein LOC127876537 [Dreissena polymorpha]XP_052277793.1 uncharacterized protein LOC127876537 [Dreissena polymorpha]XP_052277794.1 uncharacterized protein LOC127876537 [Dreissena polymorpha]XP_052277795.1 uncharacterized protein LOC127876537 [Dreissena polymorpha]KAH3842744.1 hypothetical protein DPMN_116248 [Dreissena polymorpha]